MRIFSDFDEFKAAVGSEIGAGDGLRVNYHIVIEIEGGQRPACVAELIALHYR